LSCALAFSGCGGGSDTVVLLAGQSNMLGAEASVADELRSGVGGQKVSVLQCAKAGAPMSAWTPPRGPLYIACLERMRGKRITGVLFFQGETDAQRVASALRWRSRFARFVAGVRFATAQPSLPVVFAVLGRTDNPRRFRAWNLLKREQRRVHTHCVARIETDDLAVRDEVHFTSVGYRRIGERFTRGLRRLQDASCTGG
jgi:Carbohydrate esterase, sialic acid-specific acetylesterase